MYFTISLYSCMLATRRYDYAYRMATCIGTRHIHSVHDIDIYWRHSFEEWGIRVNVHRALYTLTVYSVQCTVYTIIINRQQNWLIVVIINYWITIVYTVRFAGYELNNATIRCLDISRHSLLIRWGLLMSCLLMCRRLWIAKAVSV